MPYIAKFLYYQSVHVCMFKVPAILAEKAIFQVMDRTKLGRKGLTPLFSGTAATAATQQLLGALYRKRSHQERDM